MTANTPNLHRRESTALLQSNRALAELMLILSRDAASDLEVVSRETTLSEAMLERLRHALDCLELSVKVLTAGDRLSTPYAAEAVEREMVAREVSSAMDAHVRDWPQDGMNWLLLGPLDASKG